MRDGAANSRSRDTDLAREANKRQNQDTPEHTFRTRLTMTILPSVGSEKEEVGSSS